MAEIGGGHEEAVAVSVSVSVAVVMEKSAVIREAEAEVTAGNATAAGADEATAAVIREVVALSATATVNRYTISEGLLMPLIRAIDRSILTTNRFFSEVIGKSYWSSER